MAKRNLEKEKFIADFVQKQCLQIANGDGFVPRHLLSSYWKDIYPSTPFPYNGSQLISDLIKRTYPTITGDPLLILNSSVGDFLVRPNDPNLKTHINTIVRQKIESNMQKRRDNIKL